MSTSWNSTFVNCPAEKLKLISEAASPLLPLVFKSRLSINAFTIVNRENTFSLECAGFRAGHLNIQQWPSEITEVIPKELLRIAVLSANFLLAQLASKIVGRALWVRYSDAVGESAAAIFEHGELTSFNLAVDEEGGQEFHRPFLEAISAEVPNIANIDDLFEKIYETSSVQEFTVGG